jgi:hypothetical protein
MALHRGHARGRKGEGADVKHATEDKEEFKACMKAFEKYWRILNWGLDFTKRRKKILDPGEGRYIDKRVNDLWASWRACWDYLRS